MQEGVERQIDIALQAGVLVGRGSSPTVWCGMPAQNMISRSDGTVHGVAVDHVVHVAGGQPVELDVPVRSARLGMRLGSNQRMPKRPKAAFDE